MGRLLRLTERYARDFHALSLPPPQRRAIAGTLAALLVEDLPGPNDFEALRNPVGVAWVRRVRGGLDLWVVYTPDVDSVEIHELRTTEPVRVERE